jgi:sialidase-1
MQFHRHPSQVCFLIVSFCILILVSVCFSTASGQEMEGKIARFLQPEQLEIKPLFSGERFPSIVVAKDGTVLATWGTSRVRGRRSEDGGNTFGEEIDIAKPGFQTGGLTVDEGSGDIIAFVEDHHPPAKISIYRSKDTGKSWEKQKVNITPDSRGHAASMHMNEHGITLRHGKYQGRLIRPSRYYAGKNDRSKWPEHYTNAIYSDDGGLTWKTSEPFPANGTGEATIAELSDGTVYYNSRRHWAEEGKNPRRRWTASSNDGGETWSNLSLCQVLPDGPQDTNYGCMGGLTRLAVKGKDILVYSNCDSARGRNKGTVWASFDGGKSWPVKRKVFDGSFAYSSMTSGRPGTQTEGWIFLHFEGGPRGGSALAKFNLSWILKGELTGDGKLPNWLSQGSK